MSQRLYSRITSALIWMAAFCFAAGIFFSITLLLGGLPPTPPVAVGLVTIERYSKLHDYVAAALFFLLVPPLTIWFQRLMSRHAQRLPHTADRLLFALPYLLSPVFYLTTAKAGWILLLPVVLSFAGPRALAFARGRLWIRELFSRDLGAYHAMLVAEGIGWIYFRYIVTGRRIAHVPTLVLETIFVAMFLALFHVAAILTARLAQLNFAASPTDLFRRITTAALPLVLMPFAATIWVPFPAQRLMMTATLLVVALLAMRVSPLSERSAWRLSAFLLFPALLYLFSYVSTAHYTQWVDLFHRGESLGPASDYLRGKVPFRDVFALHGMLEDGLLDAWLMEIFGRSLDIAVARTAVIGGFLFVALWFLGLVIFDSIPLALLCVAMGSFTTAENNRTFFQVAAVALFWHALRRRSRASAFFSGVFAGIAVFFSYEIGVFTIAGAFAAALLIWIASRRVAWDGLSPLTASIFFALGTAAGVAPFAVWLAMQGALGDFVSVSFVTIPKIIDAVWSLPFPDLVSTFRNNLSTSTLADFVVREKFHLILSPLTLAIAIVYFVQRWLRRKVDTLDYALLVLTVFATIAQRTAFGRVSFTHQYFAAFLIGPLLVMLAIILIRNLAAIWRDGSEGARAFIGTLALASIPLITVLFWIPDIFDARLQDFTKYYARIFRVDRDARAEENYWRINDTSAAIAKLTKPREPIFDFSNQPAFYFFANRPNPTRFYQVPILSPREFQAETITALERTKPKVVIRRSPDLFDQFDGVTNDLRAQAVSAYIDDTYHFYQAVRGIELWTRRDDARARPVAEYLKTIRIPDEKELVNSRLVRTVFPVVGSVEGALESYWRSDLTVHNPYADPLRLTLRYVSGDYGVDRHLTLAPRQTLRWTDVVTTLFQKGGSVGTLWLEHAEGRAPVAVVKTADVAHQGRASLVEPLSARDAATAATESAELAIVGIPEPRLGRRVNVGVVNMGNVPAGFRVSARTRTGAPIGKTIEAGVPEDQVWLLNDIESKLGVKLDETMTVRITVSSGTAVGFATVVEYEGDSEFIAAIPAQQQQKQ